MKTKTVRFIFFISMFASLKLFSVNPVSPQYFNQDLMGIDSQIKSDFANSVNVDVTDNNIKKPSAKMMRKRLKGEVKNFLKRDKDVGYWFELIMLSALLIFIVTLFIISQSE